MAITREFTVLLEDRPGTLAKVCLALGGREVNILAFQSFPNSGKFVIRLIVDKPTVAKMALTNLQLTFVETQIVQTKIRHRPGEIARLASRLCRADITINYAYCGLEPGTNAPLVFFSVDDIDRAAPIQEQLEARGNSPVLEPEAAATNIQSADAHRRVLSDRVDGDYENRNGRVVFTVENTRSISEGTELC